MPGPAAGWLATRRRRGAALLACLLGASATVAWTATPAPSTGQLVDVAGVPVAGALVGMAATLLSPGALGRSDADGRYRVGARRWPYRPVRLSVGASGFVPAETWGGLLVLHRWPHVAGRVLDDAGSPLPGAVVLVSLRSEVVRVGTADLEGRFDLALPALTGDAAVSALSDQHEGDVQEVALAADRTAAVELSLARQFARLRVESDPAGQTPMVDGRAASDCQATPCELSVLAGSHVVSFVSDLFLPWQAEVQVGKDESAAVSARLERKTGTLALSAPAGGELALDGRRLPGSSWNGLVPTGPHTVTFRSAATWPASQQVDVAWNQTTQLALAPTPVSLSDPGAFLGGLRAYLAAQGGGGRFGVYLEELGTGAVIGAGDGAVMEAASVIKVPEAIYLLHRVDAGLAALDDRLDLHPEDFMGGTGSLYGRAHPGDVYSYRQLLTLLIQQSDNTAWRALRRVLGDDMIDAYAASIGAADCLQETDACSPRSAGHMLAQLARGRLLGPASTRLLLDLLETTIFNDRINYYLPGTAIAHKVGMDGVVRNDCGVVFLPGDPFAICVFVTLGDTDQGVQVIRDVARAAAWYYGH